MKKALIYGFGEGGKTAFLSLSNDYEILAFIDGDPSKTNQTFEGIPVIDPRQINRYGYDAIFVASMFVDPITKTLYDLGIDETKVIVLRTSEILATAHLREAKSILQSKSPARGDEQLTDQECLDIAIEFSKQETKSLTAREWCKVHDYLALNGHFALTPHVREKAISATYAEYSKASSYERLVSLVLAAIDSGELDRAASEVERYLESARDCEKKRTKLLEAFVHINRGHFEAASKIASDDFTSHDLAFSRLVEGSSIAIVGPCVPVEEQGKKIDDYDLVLRLSSFPTSEEESKFIGRRSDVVYMAANAPTYLRDPDELIHKRTDTFYVFENKERAFQNILLDQGRARMMVKHFQLFNSIPNFLQRILLDLSLFSPHSICLFNFDFFTGLKKHKDNSEALYDYEKFSRFRENKLLHAQVLLHDLSSQFNFTKNLVLTGRVVADERATSILNLDNLDYLKRLERSFSR